jgi:hypothetical protein
MTTTRVRKVRARSSAALRALACGAALVAADATEWEIDVMRAPAVMFADVAAGNRIQQDPISTRQTLA